MYHSALSDCVKKFIEKDARLAYDIVAALLQYWPFSISSKQILFLSEIEDLIFVMPVADFKRLQNQLGRRLAECVAFPNSDIAEKTLTMWRSDRFVKLLMQNCRDQFPAIISSLYDNATQHWQGSVHSRTFEVLKMLMEKDPELFDACSAKHRKRAEEEERKETLRQRKWAVLQDLHNRKVAAGGAHAKSPSTTMGSPSACPLRSEAPDDKRATAFGRRGTEGVLSNFSAKTIGSASFGVAEAACNGKALPNPRYGACVSWGQAGTEVSVDLQLLMLDGRGRLVGAIHEHNRVAMQAFVHAEGDRPILLGDSGDCCGGIVWLNLARAPEQVATLVVVVAAGRGCRLSDAAGCAVRIVEEATELEVASLKVEQPKSDVGVAAVIRRCNAGQDWRLSRVEDFTKAGQHFMDILEPSIGKILRDLHVVPKKQKLALAFSNMTKGDVVCLPGSCKWLFIGISWDIAPSVAVAMNNSPVNLALIYFDAQGELAGCCHVGNSEALGAKHGGGGFLGQGAMLDLAAAPADAAQVFVAGYFLSERIAASEGVQKLQCCVVDPMGTELIRFSIMRQAQIDRGFIAGRLIRDEPPNGQRWSFQALTTPLSGETWDTSVDAVRQVFDTSVRELQPLPSDLPSSGRCLVCL